MTTIQTIQAQAQADRAAATEHAQRIDPVDMRLDRARFPLSEMLAEQLVRGYNKAKVESLRYFLIERNRYEFTFALSSAAGLRHYRVDIWRDTVEPCVYGVCTCRANDEGMFCKHLAACYIAAQRILFAEGKPIRPLTGINYNDPWLDKAS